MKLNRHSRETLSDVIEMRREGYTAKQIAERVGKSKSFIYRMLRNLPVLIRQLVNEQPV